MYLSGGTHTAHFNLGLMDETTTPNRVIALIYSGGPGENIQQALDSASADWIQFNDEYDVSYSSIEEQIVTPETGGGLRLIHCQTTFPLP